MSTTTLFPRGGLEASKKKKEEKKKGGGGTSSKRKHIDDDGILFGRKKKEEKVSSQSSSAVAKKAAAPSEDDPIEACCRAGVRPGKKGSPSRIRPMKFASYNDQVWTMGIVRTTTERHMLISLPGALVGHAVTDEGFAEAGDVVRCSIVSTSRVSEKKGKRIGAKRIEVSISPRMSCKGLRLDDLANGRVTSVSGKIMSKEARGFVVELGVPGATGFMSFKRCASTSGLVPGRIVECRVIKARAETGVVDLSTDDVGNATSWANDVGGWNLASVLPGQLIKCKVERRFTNGLAVSCVERQVGGLIDRDHLGVSALGVDDVRQLDEWQAGSEVVARVLAIDRAAKLLRFTLLPHLVELKAASLPEVGTFVRGAKVAKVDDKVGALLRYGDSGVAFVHVSKFGSAVSKSAETSTDLRVVGSSALEGWTIATARPESLDPSTPIARSDLEPGATVSGAVIEAQQWGCVVRLSETLKGSVTNAHISETVAKVDPRKRFLTDNGKKVQTQVKCRVLKIEDRRITLTLKPSLVADAIKPLTSFQQAVESVGLSFVGFVTASDAIRGLVVTFYNGVHGRVPPQSLTARKLALKDFSIGQVIKVAVRRCEVRSTASRVKKPRLVLSIDDERQSLESLPQDDYVLSAGALFEVAYVVELIPPGKKRSWSALVRVKRGDHSFIGMLAASDVADHGTHGESLLQAYAKSQATFPIVVLDPPVDGNLPRLSAKKLFVSRARGGTKLPSNLADIQRALDEKSDVVGTVSATKSYGVFIGFAGKLGGLLPKALLADEFVEDASAGYAMVGDAVRCRVDRITHSEDDAESKPKIVLSTTGASSDSSSAALYAASVAIEDAVLRNAFDAHGSKIKLGATLDARVVAKSTGGTLTLVRADDVEATTMDEFFVPRIRALDCVVGDVVKIRSLAFATADSSLKKRHFVSTMEPDVVRAGRRKRRAASALTVGTQVHATAISLVDGGAACIALVPETGTLALVALGDFHCRGHKHNKDLLTFVGDGRTKEFVVAAAALSDVLEDLVTPYHDLPILVSLADEEVGKSPIERNKGTKRQKREALEAVTDPGELQAGDKIDCRVLEVGERQLKCSVHIEDATMRASATVDASDTFLNEDDTASGSSHHNPHFRENAVVGSVIRCTVIEVRKVANKGSDGKIRFAIRAGLGSFDALDRPNYSWDDILASETRPKRLDAVVVSNERDSLRVCVSPGLEGRVRTVDVVNALYADARAMTARRDDGEGMLDKVLGELEAATRPGARLVVTPLNALKKTFTVWLSEDGRPKNAVKPGNILIGREIPDKMQADAEDPARGLTLRKASIELPFGKIFSLPATENTDKESWTDLSKTQSPERLEQPYVRVVILADMERGGKAGKNLKSSKEDGASSGTNTISYVSTRPSRLALAESGKYVAAGAADPEPRPGDVCPGFVKHTSGKLGVFIETSAFVVGRVMKKDLSDGYIKNVEEEFFPGRLVAPLVTSNVDDHGRVELTLRPSAIANEAKEKVKVVPGSKLAGVVTRVDSFGVFVKLDDAPRGYESGLAHISELADDTYVEDVAKRFKKGDRVKAIILKVEDRPKSAGSHTQKNAPKRISLGLKPSYFREDDVEEADEDDEMEDDDLDDVQVERRLDDMLANDDDNDVDMEMDGDEEEGDEDDEDDEEDSDDEDEGDSGDGEEEDDEDEVDIDDDGDGDLNLPSSSRGLQWDEDAEEDDEDDDEEDEAQQLVQERKRTRRPQELEDEEAEAREAELASGNAPARNSDDFERLLVGEPDSGKLWAKYVALKISETDVTGARRVAERALDTINYRKETERFLVWISLIELEIEYGSQSAVTECVERACAANDTERILVKVAAMYEKRGNHERADECYRLAEKRCKSPKLKLDTWILHCRERLAASDDSGAQTVLSRAIQAGYDRVSMTSRYAVAEFEVGDKERGRTIFDKLLAEFPKRLDVWQLYIAKCVKIGEVDETRAIYERLAKAPLAAKQMNIALRNFFDFEKLHGDPTSVRKVRALAKKYVSAKLGDEFV